jgi:hypothetical protein
MNQRIARIVAAAYEQEQQQVQIGSDGDKESDAADTSLASAAAATTTAVTADETWSCDIVATDIEAVHAATGRMLRYKIYHRSESDSL